LYYSFNYGNAHFVALDSESILDIPKISDKQLGWVENDFKSVDRKKFPWIIVFLHRPIYCSNPDSVDCGEGNGTFALYLRKKLEPLFVKYNVDIVFTAHKHDYERMWPVYGGNPKFTYNNPNLPTYILSGAGGNREGNTGFNPNRPSWSASAMSRWGFGIMTIYNNTHLDWSFYSPDQGTPIDSITIISNK